MTSATRRKHQFVLNNAKIGEEAEICFDWISIFVNGFVFARILLAKKREKIEIIEELIEEIKTQLQRKSSFSLLAHWHRN
jgi:uncharacterized protein YgfB (UPF0149 family)